jgi:muramoyltetrapeptide carboxypeptidase
MGLRIHVPAAVRERTGYLAGPDEQRARMINELFADPSIQAVWCARGGYGTMRCLPFIDYELIKRSPKLLVGSSDATALLNAVIKRCGIPVCHGPMVVTLADDDPVTNRSIRSLFAGSTISPPPPDSIQVIRPGSAEGILMGGNLTTLCHLISTPFEPDFSGAILFLEDIGEATYRIDRMVTQMRMAGIFSEIAGLVLGRFLDCGRTDLIHQIVDIALAGLDIPVLGGVPAGHGHPNRVLPMGVRAHLDTDAGGIFYKDPFFK